jgi:hypothetical protein
MNFRHPDMKQHMMRGVQKALASPNTPAHLKPHLQKRLSGGTMFSKKMPNAAPQPSASLPARPPAAMPGPKVRFQKKAKKKLMAPRPGRSGGGMLPGVPGQINPDAFFGRGGGSPEE